VNRCITEGRKAFVDRVRGIESGAECERLAPLLSALADGEATADDMAALRPHLRGCLACRSTLREYRAAPARAAALIPPVALAAAGPAGHGGLLGWLHAHASHTAMRVHTAVEAASASKAAAVAGATAALAGGGVAAMHELEPVHPHRHHHPHRIVRDAPPPRITTPERAAARLKSRRRRPTRVHEVHTVTAHAPARQTTPPPEIAKPTPQAPPPDPALSGSGGEFAP
jgi:hypothetical protein